MRERVFCISSENSIIQQFNQPLSNSTAHLSRIREKLMGINMKNEWFIWFSVNKHVLLEVAFQHYFEANVLRITIRGSYFHDFLKLKHYVI